MYDGVIFVESMLGEGMMFFIYLFVFGGGVVGKMGMVVMLVMGVG